jgi:hypothetical protein
MYLHEAVWLALLPEALLQNYAGTKFPTNSAEIIYAPVGARATQALFGNIKKDTRH